MVVDQSHREEDNIVVPHQCQQHPRVSGRADPSHNFHFPGGFRADIQRRSGCDESGTLQGSTSGREAGVSNGLDRKPATRNSSACSGRGPPGKKAAGEHTTRPSLKSCGMEVRRSPAPNVDYHVGTGGASVWLLPTSKCPVGALQIMKTYPRSHRLLVPISSPVEFTKRLP